MAAPQAPAERLRAAGAAFIIDPHVRFKAQVGEPATMFLLDPCGNALEFKAFADPAQLFAKWPAGHARERSPPEPAGNTKKKPAGAGGKHKKEARRSRRETQKRSPPEPAGNTKKKPAGAGGKHKKEARRSRRETQKRSPPEPAGLWKS